MPIQQGCDIESIVTRFFPQLEVSPEKAFADGINPDAFKAFQSMIHGQCQKLAEAIVAHYLGVLLKTTDLDRLAVRAFKKGQSKRYKDEGKRTVKVQFAGGGVYAFEASYLRPVKRRRRGRSKKHGNRGKAGKGVFPVLDLLGIHCVHSKMKATPLLEDRVVYALTASDSHEAARELLVRWGIDWYADRLQNFVKRCGEAHRSQRADWLAEPDDDAPFDPAEFEGKRVVISADGGRCRLRQDRPGRPKDNGYHRFDAPWTEPKVFCIYVVDEDGKRLRSIRPLIDGVLVDPDDEETVAADVFFERLEAYLEAIPIKKASEVIVAGDGARWIWKRARPMLLRLGVDPDDITEVIDWYHVKSTIWDLYEKATDWPLCRRIRWRKKTLDALGDGDIERVLEYLEELPDSVRSAYGDKSDFFDRNRKRLDYNGFAEANIPRGSGAVESAIRRVINQRIKSNGKFWNIENARTMLMWRSYLKSDRFDDLLRWFRRKRADWWLESEQSPTRYDSIAA